MTDVPQTTDRPRKRAAGSRSRPKARREPVLDEDAYAWNSGKRHTCAYCNATSTWVRPWRWFGSLDALEHGRPVITLCGDECQQAYEEEHGKLEEADPLVVSAPLVPTAFGVVCPSCETTVETKNWTQSGIGYFEHDAHTIDGPFVRCTCGTLIEPQTVRVTCAEACKDV